MFGKTNKQTDFEVFVTFDSKSKTYDQPIFVTSKEVLMRDIINLMNDPKHQKAVRVLNAEDFSLFKIGSYDLVSGEITTQKHEHIVNFHELRAMSNWEPVRYEAQKTELPDLRALNPT